MSQYFSLGGLFPGSIGAASVTVVYSAGVGVVPKCSRRQRKASFSTIAMQVDAVVAFPWIRR